MTLFKFDRLAVVELLAHSQAAVERLPTVDQVTDRRYWLSGKDGEEENEGLDDRWVDRRKIPPGLWLIQLPTEPLYLSSNGSPATVIEAPELEARSLDDSEAVWEFIPLESLEKVAQDKRRKFIQLSIIKDSIAVVG